MKLKLFLISSWRWSYIVGAVHTSYFTIHYNDVDGKKPTPPDLTLSVQLWTSDTDESKVTTQTRLKRPPAVAAVWLKVGSVNNVVKLEHIANKILLLSFGSLVVFFWAIGWDKTQCVNSIPESKVMWNICFRSELFNIYNFTRMFFGCKSFVSRCSLNGLMGFGE